MQVTQEQTHPCQVDLRIEIEADRVNAAIDQAYKEFAKTTKVPGFRPGKAPRMVLEKFVGDEAAKERALEHLIQPAYSEALKQTEVDPWASAEIDLVEYEIGQPLIFTAKVPLAPKVELGEYKGLEVERELSEVTEEMVDAPIERIRLKHTRFDQITDRPAKEHDLVLVETVDEADPESKPARDVVTIGEGLPELNEGLAGMNIDEQKAISLTYPEDMEGDLAGQTKSLRVKVLEIHEPKTPELTDEWVKSIYDLPAGEEESEPAAQPDDVIDSVEKLRAEMRRLMQKSVVDKAEEMVRVQILGKVVENAKIDYPAVMIEDMVESKFEELRHNLGDKNLTIDDYMKYKDQSAEQIREQFAVDSERELKANLTLYEIIDKEGLNVEDGDVEAIVAKMTEGRNLPDETIQAYIDSVKQSKEMQTQLLQKKVLDFLVSVSNIKDVG